MCNVELTFDVKGSSPSPLSLEGFACILCSYVRCWSDFLNKIFIFCFSFWPSAPAIQIPTLQTHLGKVSEIYEATSDFL